MLFIQNANKLDQDRSNLSIVNRFQSKLNNLTELKDKALQTLLQLQKEVETLLQKARELRDALLQDTDNLEQDLDSLGINRDDTIEEIRRILDDAESELNDINDEIDSTITCLELCQTCNQGLQYACNYCNSNCNAGQGAGGSDLCGTTNSNDDNTNRICNYTCQQNNGSNCNQSTYCDDAIIEPICEDEPICADEPICDDSICTSTVETYGSCNSTTQNPNICYDGCFNNQCVSNDGVLCNTCHGGTVTRTPDQTEVICTACDTDNCAAPCNAEVSCDSSQGCVPTGNKIWECNKTSEGLERCTKVVVYAACLVGEQSFPSCYMLGNGVIYKCGKGDDTLVYECPGVAQGVIVNGWCDYTCDSHQKSCATCDGTTQEVICVSAISIDNFGNYPIFDNCATVGVSMHCEKEDSVTYDCSPSISTCRNGQVQVICTSVVNKASTGSDGVEYKCRTGFTMTDCGTGNGVIIGCANEVKCDGVVQDPTIPCTTGNEIEHEETTITTPGETICSPNNSPVDIGDYTGSTDTWCSSTADQNKAMDNCDVGLSELVDRCGTSYADCKNVGTCDYNRWGSAIGCDTTQGCGTCNENNSCIGGQTCDTGQTCTFCDGGCYGGCVSSINTGNMPCVDGTNICVTTQAGQSTCISCDAGCYNTCEGGCQSCHGTCDDVCERCESTSQGCGSNCNTGCESVCNTGCQTSCQNCEGKPCQTCQSCNTCQTTCEKSTQTCVGCYGGSCDSYQTCTSKFTCTSCYKSLYGS